MWILVSILLGSVVITFGLFSNNVFGLGCSYLSSGDGNMMSGMMSNSPQDVIIKTISSQQVHTGKDSQIVLLILDKNTGRAMTGAQVSLGLEEGAPMSTMNMIGSMFDAEELGSGKYVAKFSIDKSGYYTLHVHVIPSGKPMYYMMYNHMDVGIVAK